jgi:Na+/H+-dicarboxylate symporter
MLRPDATGTTLTACLVQVAAPIAGDFSLSNPCMNAQDTPAAEPDDAPAARGWFGSAFDGWRRIPLYVRILAGCVLGVLVGLLLRRLGLVEWSVAFAMPSKLVLRLLGALAAPLILLAVVQALMHAKFPRGSALKLFSLLILNTLVAICIGLFVANAIQPGRHAQEAKPKEEQKDDQKQKSEPKKEEEKKDPVAQFLDNIPKSVMGPLTDEGKVISVIMLALAFGIAFRGLKDAPIRNLGDLVDVSFRALIVMLHWIIEVIPLAVFGIVASIVAEKGFGAFRALGAFVLAVILALLLQFTYYLVQIRLWSWPRPLKVVRGMRDALVMAFSTASSTATMPVTYACLRNNVGVRERSASLGALVGANFNNDGTALYEAMAALFIAQLIGMELTLFQQFLVVLTSVAASVGAAGIPEAGIVTMTLVFNAVGLPVGYIPILLTVDWFLDRCRTTINVMGDVNVSCLLDGRTAEVREVDAEIV